MPASVIPIHDALDARISDYRAIRDRDLLGSAGRPGRFIGESRLVLERMLTIPGTVESVLVDARHASSIAALLERTDHSTTPLFVAADGILESIAGFQMHRGIVAIGRRPPDAGLAGVIGDRHAARTILVCEDITNVDNMGALYRDAAAFGVDAVLLSPRCHDHLYRKCLRVSVGHALALPTARSLDWPADLAALRDVGRFTTYAAATAPASVGLEQVPRAERVALFLGNEFDGLSGAALAAADHVVRIPMAAGVDSLNVAVAAAVCLHRLSTGMRG
jgi:tRNA G18 (ribose-2'-O)-methylase SpoU